MADRTDRGRPEAKRQVVTDACGAPPGITLSGTHRHDSMMMIATLDMVPSMRGADCDRVRTRLDKLPAV